MKRAIIIFISFAVIAAMICCRYFFSSAPDAVAFRQSAKQWAAGVRMQSAVNPYDGITVISDSLYINNKLSEQVKEQRSADNKRLIGTAVFDRFVDYAQGYMLDLPKDLEYDFTASPKFTTAQGGDLTIVISREWATGMGVDEYIEHYQNRFILNEDYRENNGVRLIEYAKNDHVIEITAALDDWNGTDGYTYLFFKTNTQCFYRIMLKYRTEGGGMPAAIRTAIDRIIDSFTCFRAKGHAVYDQDFRPLLPEGWSDETRALYERLGDTEAPLMWGIFTPDIEGVGIESVVPELEAYIGEPFEIILTYAHVNEPFPTEFMQKLYNENRIAQLTYQLTVNNNTDLFAKSQVLTLLRAGDDEHIREFARAAAAYKQPFLFRLNNEMNTDWTSYGGVNNMSDPELFAEAWRLIYDIFMSEGANNVIWVFNPNDRDYPPNAWNSGVAYYPGNGYVHVYGVTGYNTGTYYKELHGEGWRRFSHIYGRIDNETAGLFDAFPWMITEFASSSYGGNKARWISDMFEDLPDYPKIRAAVWFSADDYDPRTGYEGAVSRPYRLDETEETLEAFKNGRLLSSGKGN